SSARQRSAPGCRARRARDRAAAGTTIFRGGLFPHGDIGIYAPSLRGSQMKLAQKVKIALDETRMLVLGAQILLGFQFRGVFQELYTELPSASRYLDGLALLLMIVTLALLILPGTYHRIVEDGNASGGFHALTDKLAAVALIPFMPSLGIDVAITSERLLGVAGGITR